MLKHNGSLDMMQLSEIERDGSGATPRHCCSMGRGEMRYFVGRGETEYFEERACSHKEYGIESTHPQVFQALNASNLKLWNSFPTVHSNCNPSPPLAY
ncbi:hypothetical protein AMTR_s00154p00013100 [Amborella trichopoda]|uniref:Uncharacterized protein n=1 Tax=Amborella trichopoda TaxID=13333 RepID=W1PC51_AMBTC|nr:hypothetical protein AMTR_s00154p00013100 [Amborella trichopoda]